MVSKHHPAVQQIRGKVEEINTDNRNEQVLYQKFESTFYEDAQAIVTLMAFFQSYDKSQLQHYHQLVQMELNGLTGDYNPTAILGRSILGTAALLLSGITVWWGLIKMVSMNQPAHEVPPLLQGLFSTAITNRLVGIIWIVGMFVVIWYVVRMVRNRKQVSFLSSLSRALELYLAYTPNPLLDKDSQSR